MKESSNRKIVLVFDICSSTTMIENLVQNDRIADYARLINGYWNFLQEKENAYRFQIYKYLGDGFIILFEDRDYIDDVLIFCNELTIYSDDLLEWFKTKYLDLMNLPRQGITSGIALGKIYEIQPKNMRTPEYVGRPINLACRLQKTLDEKQHTNKVLLHADAYRMIGGHLEKKACKETTRSLKYISDNAEIRCYEYDPTIILYQKWDELNSKSGATQRIIEDPTTKKNLRTALENLQRSAKQLLAAYKQEKKT